jgi:hypothetical protein
LPGGHVPGASARWPPNPLQIATCRSRFDPASGAPSQARLRAPGHAPSPALERPPLKGGLKCHKATSTWLGSPAT